MLKTSQNRLSTTAAEAYDAVETERQEHHRDHSDVIEPSMVANLGMLVRDVEFEIDALF